MAYPEDKLAKEGKLQLTVRSEKVPRIVEYDAPNITVLGKLGTSRRRTVVYDYVLDERQASALSQARLLARSSGLVLEIKDLTQQSALRRLVRAGSSRLVGPSRPRFSTSGGSAGAEDVVSVSSGASRT